MLQKAEIALGEISTPKLSAGDPSRLFYKYYAGFSEAFVEDVLRFVGVSKDQVILDPWNGAGTTTSVAAAQRLRAIGYDLNPALAVIAKARGLDPVQGVEVLSLFSDYLSLKCERVPEIKEDDPLLRWFGPPSVELIRTTEAILRSAMGQRCSCRTASVNFLEPTTALLYAVMFRALRQAARMQFGSNPTWIRHGTAPRRTGFSQASFVRLLKQEADTARKYFELRIEAHEYSSPSVAVGSSTELDNLKAGSVELTISSPPYCTRIDYAIATSMELALLSAHHAVDFSVLRSELIGTPLTSKSENAASPSWGRSCNEFLQKVQSHSSKASSTYYYRYYLKYFDRIFQSLSEITRVTAPKGRVVLVVQNSYYKNVRLDLATVFLEMLVGKGWIFQYRKDFPVGASFTYLNPKAKFYPKLAGPVESALFLAKE